MCSHRLLLILEPHRIEASRLCADVSTARAGFLQPQHLNDVAARLLIQKRGICLGDVSFVLIVCYVTYFA